MQVSPALSECTLYPTFARQGNADKVHEFGGLTCNRRRSADKETTCSRTYPVSGAKRHFIKEGPSLAGRAPLLFCNTPLPRNYLWQNMKYLYPSGFEKKPWISESTMYRSV